VSDARRSSSLSRLIADAPARRFARNGTYPKHIRRGWERGDCTRGDSPPPMREAYVSFIAPLETLIRWRTGRGGAGRGRGGEETRRGRPKRNLLLAIFSACEPFFSGTFRTLHKFYTAYLVTSIKVTFPSSLFSRALFFFPFPFPFFFLSPLYVH